MSGAWRGVGGARWLAIVAAWCIALASCSEPPTGRQSSVNVASVPISASVVGTPVSTLVITVSASDIQPTLVFNIEVANGVASGTIAIPVGTARTVLVRAVDATGADTHKGSRVLDVGPGLNPVISIALVPLVAGQPIDVRVGSLLIAVRPSTMLIGEGRRIALSATATDVSGNPVVVDPSAIKWASFDPRVATVDAAGVLTGVKAGSVKVIASYSGAAGAADVEVGVVILAAGDIAKCGSTSGDELTAAIIDTIPGTVLPLGDNVYDAGSLLEYMTCYEPSWGRHKARSRPVPGNHEYNTPGAAGYFDYFGPIAGNRATGYYSYDLGAWHLIALNSEVPSAERPLETAWLKNDLAASSAKCVLAYWHKPRFSDGDAHGNNASFQVWWDSLYKANGDVILGGHDHVYQRFAPQTPTGAADPVRGVREFVVGTGGGGLYGFVSPLQPTSEFERSEYGVLMLVLGESRYSWSFIAAPSGAVRDSGTTACH